MLKHVGFQNDDFPILTCGIYGHMLLVMVDCIATIVEYWRSLIVLKTTVKRFFSLETFTHRKIISKGGFLGVFSSNLVI